MKTIAVTNRKGGVGKSTMSSHIAVGLAYKGYNVALVDTDSQGNAGLMLGIGQEDGLFDLLIEKKPLDDVVRYVPKENYGSADVSGNLLLIPSSDRTYQIPYMLKSDESFLFLEKLEEFGANAKLDYIVIDTNPSLSLFDGSVYLAADAFVYVTECEMLSLQGVQRAFEQLKNFGKQRRRYLQRESKILGIIPNKFRSKTIIHQENIKKLIGAFGDLVWDPVVLRTIWTECSNIYQPVFLAAPDSAASKQAWDIVNRAEKELLEWQKTEEI